MVRSSLMILSPLLAFSLAQALPVQAATVVNISGGVATGISDLVVGTNHYDVTFLDGTAAATYDSVYGTNATYEAPYSDAANIAAAIISSLNALTPSIPDIAGTDTGQGFDGFFIPQSVTTSDVAFYYSYHSISGTAAYLSPALYIGGRSYSYNATYVWASVASTAVTPLPAALPLFAAGLSALGLLGWRRKKAAFPS